jgi:hypothetical protein
MSFQKGDSLRLKIGGTAKRILVRLLPEGSDPGSPIGIVGGAINVPDNRIVKVRLDYDYRNIKQISVHGHSNPWDIFLGANNGPATLIKVEYKR